MNILKIDSSPMGEHSTTRQLSAYFADLLKEHSSGASITDRDLSQSALTLLDAQTIGAFFTPTEALSENQKDAIELSDRLVSELEQADVIMIGAPMHNFSVNGYLKAYIDQIARVGRTFAYTESGPQGLLQDKKVYVMVASGGDYTSGPMAAMDHLTTYLKTVLGFVGLTDVTFIQSTSTAASDDKKAQSILAAKKLISDEVLAFVENC